MAGYFPILWVHYNLLIFWPLAIQPMHFVEHFWDPWFHTVECPWFLRGTDIPNPSSGSGQYRLWSVPVSLSLQEPVVSGTTRT